jgi:hypothetical protein
LPGPCGDEIGAEPAHDAGERGEIELRLIVWCRSAIGASGWSALSSEAGRSILK